MLRYSQEEHEWLDPQTHLKDIAVNVTRNSLRVREIVQGYSCRDSSYFPGMQPVSMTTLHLKLLQNRSSSYVVAFKTDGIRAFMTLLPGDKNIYLTTRTMETYRIQYMNKTTLFTRSYNQRLLYQLDGELLCYKKEGELKFEYIPHDILVYRGQYVEPLTFENRMKCLDTLIKTEDLGLKRKRDTQAFHVHKKLFLSIEVLKTMEENKLGVPTDGFIFQSKDAPYKRGTCTSLLKWKPKEYNSVDFRIYVSATETPNIFKLSYTCSDGTEVHSELTKVSTRKSKQRCLSFHGKIIECIRNPKTGGWKGIRCREDKLQPNALCTYHKIVESINNGVSWKQLLTVTSTK